MKITESTTPREVFDFVARHLLTQAESATDGNGNCMYRAPNGCKCAIGALLDDEDYGRIEEGYGIGRVVEALGWPRALKPLMRDLQMAHDCLGPASWSGSLRRIGEAYGLNTEVLNEFGG